MLLACHAFSQETNRAYYSFTETHSESENKLFKGISVTPLSIYADTMSLDINEIIYQESILNWEVPKELTPQIEVVYWLRTSMTGNDSFHGPQVFHVSPELGKDLFASDYIDTYTIDKSGHQTHQKTGRLVAQKDKPLDVWINLIELNIDKHDTLDVFIRLEGLHPNFVTDYYLLWHLDYHYFLSKQVGVAVRTSIFFGVMAIMILFFVFLYLIEKEIVYLFFSVFAMGLLFTRVFAEFNLDSFVLIPSLIPYYQIIFLSSVCLSTAGGIYFMSNYLNIPKDGIFMKRVVPIYLALAFFSNFKFLIREPKIPGEQYFREEGVINLLFIPGVYTFLSLFFGIYMLIAAPKSKNSSKLFLMIAILPMIIGTALTVTLDMGWLPDFFTVNMLNEIMKISTILLVLTLGLIVGYKSKALKSEKDLAIQDNLKAEQTIFEKQMSTEKLEEMNNLKARLYTNITHEFRTPLTVIMGINDELSHTTQKLNLPSGTKDKILKNQQLIQRNSENLLILVNQLLDLSKADNHKLELKLIQADVIPFLNYLTESFFSKAKEKGIRLLFYSEIPSVVMDYDEQKVQHLIFNLLSNALKFTEENGKIVLHASCFKVEDDMSLILKIVDNGIGIAEEKLPFIFDRFYQVDDSQTRQVDGSGIGLSLVKEIVFLMDGEITVQSEIGLGTTFIIKIPVRNTAVIANEENSYKPQTPIISTLVKDDSDVEDFKSGKEKPLILLVEDNKDVLLYIEQILGDSYTIKEASNGEIGISKAIEYIPDLIISDVMMPKKDGFQLTEALKQDSRTSHIPIILLTAKATMDDRIAGLKIGANAYLNKPFNKEELLIRIEQLLEVRHVLKDHFMSTFNNGAALGINLQSQNDFEKEENYLNELKDFILKDLMNNQLNADYLANKKRISQSQLYRKMKALTGETPNIFIRNIRLQQSLELLKNSDLNISEIAYEVGFTNPSYFSKSFHKKYGKSPLAYRKLS